MLLAMNYSWQADPAAVSPSASTPVGELDPSAALLSRARALASRVPRPELLGGGALLRVSFGEAQSVA